VMAMMVMMMMISRDQVDRFHQIWYC